MVNEYCSKAFFMPKIEQSPKRSDFRTLGLKRSFLLVFGVLKGLCSFAAEN